MKRKIIQIDEEKCNGCGLCIPECKEGALQIIEGKARLVSDLFCDGLGACLGYCPEGAIEIIEREAEPYSERKVIEIISKQPTAVLKAHLKHLIEHQDMDHYIEALEVMHEMNIPNPIENEPAQKTVHEGGGCPGSRIVHREQPTVPTNSDNQTVQSDLNQWPVQLHLVSPNAPYFKNAELVIMSTCGPIAAPDIHPKYLRGRAVVVACPKLDYTSPYTDKLAQIFMTANTPKAIIVIMEVPCCKGLSKHVTDALEISGKKDMIIEEHTLSLDGKLLGVKILS